MSACTQPEIFQGRESFAELSHIDKHFIKNTRKKVLQENILEVFLLDTNKTTFWMEIVTPRWTQSGPFFFSKIIRALSIFKKEQRRPPPLSPHLVTSNWHSCQTNRHFLIENVICPAHMYQSRTICLSLYYWVLDVENPLS